MDLEKHYRFSSRFQAEYFEHGALLLGPSGRLLEVNPVGARILQLLESEQPFGDLVHEIQQEYEIPYQVAVEDSTAFCSQLRSLEVIEEVRVINVRDVDKLDTSKKVIAHIYTQTPNVKLTVGASGGGVLHDASNNEICWLNPTGLFIWQNCDGARSQVDLAKLIVSAFDEIELEDALQDVTDIVKKLVEQGALLER